jgi:23S rRNA (guanosine2251-2'-O)-methyltransferase
MNSICLIAVDIRSTYNVGSLFRTADGFSAEIILVGITPRPLGGKKDDRLPHIAKKAHEAIRKTALGAEINVRWRYFSSFLDALRTVKNEGYYVAAIEQHESSKPVNELVSSAPVAVVVGPEVEGLSKEIIALCDSVYEIPMTGSKESFNVSVAAGIALYQSRIKQ